jgi:Bacterial mobilisation protein (MobC)
MIMTESQSEASLDDVNTVQEKKHKPLTEVVSMRVPKEVAQGWNRRSKEGGLSRSNWMRLQIKDEAIGTTNRPAPRRRPALKGTVAHADAKLVLELARLGNNLNQVARAIHSSRLNNPSINLIPYLQPLHTVETILLKIADHYLHVNGHAD